MTKFTKEQLIARIEKQIDINATIIERLGDDSTAVSELAVEVATMDIQILDIAMAALTAAPEAYVVGGYSLLHYQNPKLDEYIKNATPLYRLPLLEGLK